VPKDPEGGRPGLASVGDGVQKDRE